MFKKAILFNRVNETEQYTAKVVIGVVGIEHGVGTTHFTILLANYYHKWLHRKTILIEYGQNEVGCLKKGLDEAFSSNCCYESLFYVKGIPYYPYVKPREISSILAKDYEYAIIDFGAQYIKAKEELLRCDYKVIIGHHAIWKQYLLRNFIEEMKEYYNPQWLYILPFMEESRLKKLNKSCEVKCYSFPCEPNPFYLSARSLLVLERLFGL